jgi:integrase
MRWSDIDGEGMRVLQNKTGARLRVPFSPHLRTVLSSSPKPGVTICACGRRELTSSRGASDQIMAARINIGSEKYDLHGPRYSAASELAEPGCSDELIAAINGHSTSAMMRKYAGAAR